MVGHKPKYCGWREMSSPLGATTCFSLKLGNSEPVRWTYLVVVRLGLYNIVHHHNHFLKSSHLLRIISGNPGHDEVSTISLSFNPEKYLKRFGCRCSATVQINSTAQT